MKKDWLWIIPLAVAILGITCYLPSLKAANDDDLQQLADQLGAMRLEEQELGELHDWDNNGDGVVEKIEYTLPTYEVVEDVTLSRSLFSELKDEGWVFPGYTFNFQYQGDDEVEFEYVVEIPKENAASIDDLEFSIPPDEVINPDPSVAYNIRMGKGAKRQVDLLITGFGILNPHTPEFDEVKQKVMEGYYEESVLVCDTLYPAGSGLDDSRNVCLLNLVEDYRDFIDRDELVSYCYGISDTLRSNMCRAILDADITNCSSANLNEDEQDLCKGYFISNLCDSLEGEEKVLCLAENAISFESPVACMTIPAGDIRQDCLARTTKDKAYCDQIKDDELRQTCKGEVADKVEPEVPENTEEESNDEKPTRPVKKRYSDIDWFPPESAEKECSVFSGIMNEYPFTWVDGEGTKLWCNWGPGPDWISTTQEVNIHVFNSNQEARQRFDSNYGKDSDFWLETEDEDPGNATVFNAQHTGDWVFIVFFTESTSTYRVEGAALNGNAVIRYTDYDAKITDPSRFDAILEAADVLLSQKRNE